MLFWIIAIIIFFGIPATGALLLIRQKQLKLYYLSFGIVELLLVLSFFLCRGGIGSGIECPDAGVFDPILGFILSLFALSGWFGIPFILAGFMLLFPFTDIVYQYVQCRKNTEALPDLQPSFFSRSSAVWYPIIFLLLQIGFFFTAKLALDIEEKERYQRIDIVDLENKSRNAKEELEAKKQNEYYAQPFLERAKNRLVSESKDEGLYMNAVVVQDMVEVFIRQNKRLPSVFHELQTLDQTIPLPFQYANEADKAAGRESIGGVYYQWRSAESYALCADFTTNPLPQSKPNEKYNQNTRCVEVVLDQGTLDYIGEEYLNPLIVPVFNLDEWINQVEGRFSEPVSGYVPVNNVLVLNDVIERFRERYGKLPANAAELTSFIPTLKPRYKSEEDRASGLGRVYGVLYRQKGDREYELCIESQSMPESLDPLGTWQQVAGLYCLERQW